MCLILLHLLYHQVTRREIWRDLIYVTREYITRIFLISCSSEVGFGGLPCRATDRGRMDSGQGEVRSAGGISSALCNMQGGVSPSASGIPPTQQLLLILCERALSLSLFFFFTCFQCSVCPQGNLCFRTHTHMGTHTKPPPPPAVPVCSNLCRQLYKFTHTALELNCDVMMQQSVCYCEGHSVFYTFPIPF